MTSTSAGAWLWGALLALAPGCSADNASSDDDAAGPASASASASGAGGASASSGSGAGPTSSSSGAGTGGSGGGGVVPWASAGFGAPTSWTLSQDLAPHGFLGSSGSVACDGETVTWFGERDVDGDGLLDTIIGHDGCGTSGAGDGTWRVYPSTPTGMGAPVTWTVPTLPGGYELVYPSFLTSCGDTFDFLKVDAADLDGDGELDAVITQDACFGSLGDDSLAVYWGNGAGYDLEPESWALPGWPVDPFAGFSTLERYNGNMKWNTRDYTGDKKPDLVVFHDEINETGVGVTHLNVYANTGSGFAMTPTTYALPPLLTGLADWNGAYDAACTTGSKGLDAIRRDITGDGRDDLVVRRYQCGPSAKPDSVWWIYPGGDDGFASEHVDWAFPAEIAAVACSFGDRHIVHELDADGDGRDDLLVVRDDCTGSNGIGTSHWNVYQNVGDGFRADPVPWALPTPPGYGFAFKEVLASNACNVVNGQTLSIHWATREVTGDGVMDLIVTSDGCDPDADLGVAHWRVFPGGVVATP